MFIQDDVIASHYVSGGGFFGKVMRPEDCLSILEKVFVRKNMAPIFLWIGNYLIVTK